MAENVSLTTFNGGVLTPKCWERVDIEKYSSSCRRLENFLVLKEGGVERRPGTHFIYKSEEPVFGAGIDFMPDEDVVYESGYNITFLSDTTTPICQTFTTDGDTEVVSVTMLLAVDGLPGDAVLSLYAVDGNHKPTGTALGSKTVVTDDIESIGGTNEGQEQVVFEFDSPIELDGETEYAIVLNLAGSEGASLCVWYADVDLYADGDSGGSVDSGSTWTMSGGTNDYCFSVNV